MSRRSIFAPSSERNRPTVASVSVFRLMRIYHSAQGRNAIDVARRLERPVRLTTGLILFAFATSHLIIMLSASGHLMPCRRRAPCCSRRGKLVPG